MFLKNRALTVRRLLVLWLGMNYQLAISTCENYDEIVQIDITAAFLDGKLDEEIYMIQPEGYIGNINLDFVYRPF